MISVIIINKNDLGIINTIKGLNAQNFKRNFEILVIDRSTIDYPKFKSKVPLRWINFDPKGKQYTIPEQRNVGVKKSKGNIVVFIDANCIPEKNWLTKLLQPIMIDDEKIVMGKTGSIGKSNLNNWYHAKIALKNYVDEAPTVNLAIAKDVFKKVGMFDEELEYGSDVDFSWRAIDKGYNIRYQPSAFIAHDWGDSKQDMKRAILYGKARARILIKHFRTRWKNLFGKNFPALLYPVLILFLPLSIIFPWYLLVFILLVLKNLKEPNPTGIVINNIVYGCGVLIELKNQSVELLRKVFVKTSDLEFTYLLGFALFATIIYGLSINYILPKFGFKSPLSYVYIWPVYFFFLFPLAKLLSGFREWISGSFSSLLLKVMLLLNPVLAVMGVRFLDNTGNGSLAMVSVLLICLNFTIVFLQKNQRAEVLKLSLYSSAISLLLSNSLRSNFLAGWDIHQEYLVFRLTNLHNLWDIQNIKNPYNACLSITILPTIIRNLLGVASLTVYRFIFPLLIALIPVVVYQVGTRITDKKIAYAGAFVFLIQTQYFYQLPALLRQGVAFLFFALMIDLLVNTSISQRRRNIFILVLGTGMILSHYSTTYVALALLSIAKIVSVLSNRFWPCKEKFSALSYKIIAILFLITILWNVFITNTANGLMQTAVKIVDNIGNTFSVENKSDMIKSIFYQQPDNVAAVINYSNKSLQGVASPQDYKGYQILPVSLDTERQILLTDPIPFYFHVLIPWIFRLSIILGFVFLLRNELKKRQTPLIISISFSMFLVIFSLILLPYVSVDYNFERVYQQMLILLAPISIVGFFTIFKLIKKISRSVLIIIILLSFVVQSTGLIDHLVYGSSRWMFDNSGEQYYRYFSTSSEITGISWLEKNTNSNILLYADEYTNLRLQAFSNQKFSYISDQINPPVIEKYGYVFSGLAGTKVDTVFAKVNNQALEFSFPDKYLSTTRNVIYSNSNTKIYK